MIVEFLASLHFLLKGWRFPCSSQTLTSTQYMPDPSLVLRRSGLVV